MRRRELIMVSFLAQATSAGKCGSYLLQKTTLFFAEIMYSRSKKYISTHQKFQKKHKQFTFRHSMYTYKVKKDISMAV
jgi:hypothetical protein